MNKKYLIFIIMTLLVLTLTLALSGCGRDNNELEGKYIATFELNGGTLDILTSSTNTKINFAYYPGTYIIDPAEIPGYKLFKNGYVFTGWYTSPECKPEEKWDFESTLFNTETLTLYAGWEKAIVYSFTLYYVDGEKDVELGKYAVSAGEGLDDWRKFAENREGYTPLGYFADRNFTSPWNNKTVHPGGDADLDIPVYVNYIKGDWALVSDHASLGKAVSAGKNVYLLNDIDCHNEELNFDDTYSGVFEGNNYKVSNFTEFQIITVFQFC